MEFLAGILSGLVVGLTLGAVACWWWQQRQRAALQAAQVQQQQQAEAQWREAFKALAADALQANTQHLLSLTQTQLGQQTQAAEGVLQHKAQQVTTSLGTLKEQLTEHLTRVSARLEQLEKERATQYTTLDQRLTQAADVIGKLQVTTGSLQQTLGNTRTRGQWGERMAEDVLRLAGLQEGISYFKQPQLSDGSRPDYGFPLPGGRTLYMDVKFPLEQYLASVQASHEGERQQAQAAFLTAVRGHIKTTAGRSYKDQDHGLDYVVVFIPNEQIYAYLFEHDPQLLGYALGLKVILCSPTTLLAVLALIRQAEQAFQVDKQYAEVAKSLAQFAQQWRLFSDSHEGVKKAFDKVAKEFDELVGKRTSLLDRAVEKLTLAAPKAAAGGAVPSVTGTPTPLGFMPLAEGVN
jgi:DNA recombination protein RmuC